MAGHVFISYASSDFEVAKRVCDGLEQRGTKCWIAPRDVNASESYADEIVSAIEGASSMVVILSSRAQASRHVVTEIERAFSNDIRMFPIRLEEFGLSKELQYFLSRAQWVDAFGKDPGPSLERLVDQVTAGKAKGSKPETRPEVRVEPPKKPVVETELHPTKRRRPWLRWALGGVVVAGLGIAYVNVISVHGGPQSPRPYNGPVGAAAAAGPVGGYEPGAGDPAHKKTLKKKPVQEPTQ
jgi:hypothetical protein